MIVIFKDNLYISNGFSAKLVPWGNSSEVLAPYR